MLPDQGGIDKCFSILWNGTTKSKKIYFNPNIRASPLTTQRVHYSDLMSRLRFPTRPAMATLVTARWLGVRWNLEQTGPRSRRLTPAIMCGLRWKLGGLSEPRGALGSRAMRRRCARR